MRSHKNTLLLLIVASLPAAAESLKVKTPRGADLDVMIDYPAKGTNVPAIVVAPGANCNSTGPIFSTLAQKAAAAGYAVIRFEWEYCRYQVKRDDDSPENLALYKKRLAAQKKTREDYLTVLKHVQGIKKVDPNRIFAAGKSLGSVVSHEVFMKEPSLAGNILFTPLCTSAEEDPETKKIMHYEDGASSYPGIATDKRKFLMVAGDNDNMCYPAHLKHFAADKPNLTAVLVPGDHGYFSQLEDGITDDMVKTQQNIDQAMNETVKWLKKVTPKASKPRVEEDLNHNE